MISGNVGSITYPEYNTALEFAEKEGHGTLAKFLRSKGALTSEEASSKNIEEKVRAWDRFAAASRPSYSTSNSGMTAAEKEESAKRIERLARKREAEVVEEERSLWRVRIRANQLAAAQGLDMRESSPDYKAFWNFAKVAPAGVPFEDQVKLTVNKVKALKPWGNKNKKM